MAAVLRFRRSQRLTGRGVFAAVIARRARRQAGPLVFHARPAEGTGGPLQHHRMGLSVGRKVGTAVRRNRIKRLIRESFRLSQHTLTPPDTWFDFVVIVRPHEPATLADYDRWWREAATHLQQVWARRARREGGGDA